MGIYAKKGWMSRARMRPCKRDGTAKRKRCAYERDALSCFFLCPFGDNQLPFAVRTRTTLSCLQAALSLIRPRKSIFDSYVTLLHYCFPYSLRASDTHPTQCLLIWSTSPPTWAPPSSLICRMCVPPLSVPAIFSLTGSLIQERSALLNARDIDNTALCPSQGCVSMDRPTSCPSVLVPPLFFPFFPPRTRHLSFLIRCSHHGNTRLPPMV
jgi:hypothetical protein